MCQISVITSVYNGERFIAETIESIRNQTFTDFEWLIFDNCSTDATVSIIESYAGEDSRIRLFCNERNCGQIPNLNRGIELSKGRYIARTDADDISYPQRLWKQHEYMEKHPDTVLIGAGMDQWRSGEKIPVTGGTVFQSDPECRFGSLFFCVLPNSSFFFRKDALGEIRYRNYDYAEDWALIVDLLGKGEVAKIAEPLIMYRIYGEQVTQRLSADLRIAETEEIMHRYLQKLPIDGKEILWKAIRGRLENKEEFQEMKMALLRYALYCKLGEDEKEAAEKSCVQRAYRTLIEWQNGNMALLRRYMTDPLCRNGHLFSRSGLSFLKKCLKHYGKKRSYGG